MNAIKGELERQTDALSDSSLILQKDLHHLSKPNNSRANLFISYNDASWVLNSKRDIINSNNHRDTKIGGSALASLPSSKIPSSKTALEPNFSLERYPPDNTVYYFNLSG